jgi:hypothetical protein
MDLFRAMFMASRSASTVYHLSSSSKDLLYFWEPRLYRLGKGKATSIMGLERQF